MADSDNLFSEFEPEDYVDNKPMIRVLALSEGKAQETIIQLRAQHETIRRSLERSQRELNETKLNHEQRNGLQQTEIARLAGELEATKQSLAELSRQSTVAVAVAWVGTVLIGFGVNLVTGGDQEALGVALIGLGAIVGTAAFVIPRRKR
ncbi:LPXTG-motif cell wall-anchored protein [Micromonospora sp. HB375]|uniref:LPXTG cell wall anchor domain-containing protein n=1 Tax=Micromonospora TaxID=1873 RepID=UPI001AE2EB2E|nr:MULTISPECIES: LPXTG cell wall anchor domain-containing protein [unclassified Micromonospora]MBP1782715.1 LPXTG-motif cell wall-anchored protein [Micromonospora sp. HB375]MDH6472037.1 LPXTG-motif cell wall-anchored protein [Micromonospora sp. H404/HB375]